MSVGMPAFLFLQEFGSQVWSAFGEPPYLVGSALKEKSFRKESQERMAQLELEIKQTIIFYCGNLGKGHVAIGYPSTEVGQVWGVWPPYMGSVSGHQS